MSKRDKAYKRSARVEAERASKETEKMIKKIKKDLSAATEKVNLKNSYQ